MKILLLNQTFHPDGSATAQQLTGLARFLTARGHRVTVIADRRNYETRRADFPEREVIDGIEVHRVLTTPFGKRRFRYRIVDGLSFELLALWRILLLPRQDLVVSFTSPPLVGLLGCLYGKLARCATVQWLMDINPDAAISIGLLKADSWLGRTLVHLFELSVRHSSRVVVLDRWMRERAIARGAAREDVAIIPPWPVDAQATDAATDGAIRAFRREAGLEGKFVVLYAGNHSVVHPLDTILEAALRLRDDDGIRFVFTGGGVRVKDVAEFRERHRLDNILQLSFQPREKLAALLGSGDLHTVVMGNEVNGLVHASKIYGVLAAARPYVFVGPKSSHGADLLAQHPYGFHVEHGDVDRLVAVVRQVQKMPEAERRTMGARNVEVLRAQFDSKITLARFEREVLEPLFGRAVEPRVAAMKRA